MTRFEADDRLEGAQLLGLSKFSPQSSMEKQKKDNESSPTETKAKELSRQDQKKEEVELDAKKKEHERPWHREGVDRTVVEQEEGQDDGSSRGKLLTTPTRLLKLILPLPTRVDLADNEKATDEKLEPLALLVHPHQPLSYIERLLQAELPPLKDSHGREKVPDIYFRAEDAAHGDNRLQGSGREGNVASYSGLGHLGPRKEDTKWVRWSSSTEVGDFIRDAARGREFAIEMEGYGTPGDHADINFGEVRIAVPSFHDRTHYMRQRLRTMSRRIDSMSKLKNECDEAAHQGAHRLAQGGFVGLVGWWAVVYYTSFHTDVGWDLVEPVTYLAGLTTIMGGYLWFLYISRDLSYRAALNVTVSRRQHALYKEKGFDLQRWENAVHEANALRREVRMVADEYDVDWDEAKDLGGEAVKEVLENEEDERTKEEERRKKADKELERDQSQEKHTKE
ncbi:uncharacterized protein MKZ38_008241 [Zalerion maritima]|uniref:Calcium uniporter protein n=1 Tax=Zalerion maritima TaxID=339359 RepID=A0AAD5RHP2_9PEZI|nr:uncharacterized protein MKZ38_008241 [Zalerion maritima]